MTSTMVNIPRDEIVDVLTGITLLQREDARSLRGKLNEFVASISGTPPFDPTGVTDDTDMHLYMHDIVQVMADSLILNDRTLPLVSPAAVAELSRHVVSPLSSDASDEDRRIQQVQIDAVTACMESIAVQLSTDNEKDYDRTWRQIEAFRKLSAERGNLDIHDQSLRDEFVRMSSTPEEWAERTSKIIDVFTNEFPKLMEGVVKTLIAMFAASDPEMGELDADDLEEIDDAVTDELKKVVAPIMAQISGVVQAYMDERYIDIWVKPTV